MNLGADRNYTCRKFLFWGLYSVLYDLLSFGVWLRSLGNLGSTNMSVASDVYMGAVLLEPLIIYSDDTA